MVREARHELLVMSDSDVRVTPNLLSHLAREFQDQRVGLITCPYRAVPGASVWSRLEAVGMNTELLGGVLVARMVEGMRFALGCTVAVRRSVLDDMGGFGYLQEFLAEDFVIGHRAAELGHGVPLSSYIIEHRIGSQGMMSNLGHRLRWARSTRRSRPAGYWGQIFTYPMVWALLSFAAYHAAWPFSAHPGPAWSCRRGHGAFCASRSCHAKTMVVTARAGRAGLSGVDQRFRRRHDCLA